MAMVSRSFCITSTSTKIRAYVTMSLFSVHSSVYIGFPIALPIFSRLFYPHKCKRSYGNCTHTCKALSISLSIEKSGLHSRSPIGMLWIVYGPFTLTASLSLFVLLLLFSYLCTHLHRIQVLFTRIWRLRCFFLDRPLPLSVELFLIQSLT